jgi:hypothetical protein
MEHYLTKQKVDGWNFSSSKRKKLEMSFVPSH